MVSGTTVYNTVSRNITIEALQLLYLPALLNCSRNYIGPVLNYFVASTMKDIFEEVSLRNVINFIKETHFYNLL